MTTDVRLFAKFLLRAAAFLAVVAAAFGIYQLLDTYTELLLDIPWADSPSVHSQP